MSRPDAHSYQRCQRDNCLCHDELPSDLELVGHYSPDPYKYNLDGAASDGNSVHFGSAPPSCTIGGLQAFKEETEIVVAVVTENGAAVEHSDDPGHK